MRQRQVSAAVLAGGASRRMGSDKAMLDIGGASLVSRIVERLEAISDDIFVVAKRPLDIDRRVVLEATEPQTPLLGVLTALRAARHPFIFVCGCDMPFVSAELVRYLSARMRAVDAVVPLREGKLEALHGVWSVSAADKIEALIDGERGLRRALRQLDVDVVEEDEWRSIDPEGRAFTNLNTPEDVAAIRLAPNVPRPSDRR